MTLAEFVRWAGYLNGIMDAALLVQLLRYRLARKYGWIFCYFLADAVQPLLLIPLPVFELVWAISTLEARR